MFSKLTAAIAFGITGILFFGLTDIPVMGWLFEGMGAVCMYFQLAEMEDEGLLS